MRSEREQTICDHYEIAEDANHKELFEDRNLRWQKMSIIRHDREKLNGHRGGVIWFTGLSGSGKSTLANALEKQLYAMGIRTYLMDGDNVRQGLNRDLGFRRIDRTENIRRIAEVAKLFVDAGIVVLTAFISPYDTDRCAARDIIGKSDFFEVFVDCALEECEKRDPKGLYAKARRGEILEFTGVSDPYEIPENPDLIVATDKEEVEAAIERILIKLKKREFY
ncbi:adenylylsulfate kinase ApsK [Desulfosporosinus acidiphilus SJ4]|uniref:Adenylyl-sulfate kinase n=1 Tax=Desulfosporosinus acidiphilus (strain DSM 22704 / JCM 16185 / SJ4) TaxID=646529 RepID=I4DBS2_DESAJ|nr:adenylyl-sulfate kinase [Desulfosporosinus acidiphilus]AFM43246.1 adenylylsulfate kinase ApsK [Desulfosporosinus acidiphilus SJ4]